MCSGSPMRMSLTFFSTVSRRSTSISSRRPSRSSVSRPCAVIPSSSLSARPIRFLPRSSARMRPVAVTIRLYSPIFPGSVVLGSGHGRGAVAEGLAEARQQNSQTLTRDHMHGYALTTIAAGVLIAILYWARVVFITTIISVIIALILEPLVGLLVRIKLPRPLAALMVGLIAALGLYFAGLAAYNQLAGLASDVPAFKENLSGFIGGVTDRIQNVEDTASRFLVPTRKAQPAPATPPPATTRRNRRAAPPVEVVVPGAIPEVRRSEQRR